jgi:hypothetical protein
VTRAAPRRRATPERGASRRRATGARGGKRVASRETLPAFIEHIEPGVPTTTVTPRRPAALEGPGAPAAVEPRAPGRARRSEIIGWPLVAVAGLLLVVASGLTDQPQWLSMAGATASLVAYVWVLAARTGGRPVVFSALTAVAGGVTIATDRQALDTGMAVLAATVAAVLAVVITVPAVRFREAARECLIAVNVAGGGAVTAIGFAPAVDLARFEYVVLALALAGSFTLVYRLGAGLHGLGRRGVFIVIFGAVVLVATLLYAEALRRYAAADAVDSLLEFVRWSRETVGAFPRPIETILGVPALAWGTHMRARRRQGWWVCAFGAAGTTAVAVSLMNPEIGLLESTLSVIYGLVAGLVIGLAVIRIDLALTGSGGGRRAVSRRGLRAEEREKAVRPEPPRTHALL